MAGPSIILFTTVPSCIGDGYCYFAPRNDSSLDARIRAYPAQSWAFDRWEVGTAGSTWTGGVWWRDSDNGDGSHDLLVDTYDLNYVGEYEDNVLRLQIVAVFRYIGSGTAPPEQQKIVVSVNQAGDGDGDVTGGGTYPVGASYTVSGMPSESPLSAVTEMSSSLGHSQAYVDGVGTVRSVTATATQDVVWTITFRRVYKVGLLAILIAGGASSAIVGANNCSPSFSGHMGTRTDDRNHANRTLYLFVAGATCTVSANPTYPAEVVRFRSSGGGSWDGQTQASFAVDQDTDIYILCLFGTVNLETTSNTTYVENNIRRTSYNDLSGGVVSLSSSTDVQPGTQVTVTATATPGVVVSADGLSESSYSFDDPVLHIAEYRPYLIQETTYLYSVSPVTVTIVGRNVAEITAGQNLPSWTGTGGAASSSDPKIWFFVRTETLAVGCFIGVTRYYEFEVQFDFKTYGSRFNNYLSLDNRSGFGSGTKFRCSNQDKTLTINGGYVMTVAGGTGFILGVVDKSGGTRTVLYRYRNGQTRSHSYAVTLPASGQTDGAVFAYDIWVWPDPTGKILYSPSNSGKILRGSGGSPMAQFVDT